MWVHDCVSGKRGKGGKMGQTQSCHLPCGAPLPWRRLSGLATTFPVVFGVVALSDQLVYSCLEVTGAGWGWWRSIFRLLLSLRVAYCDWTNDWEDMKLNPLEHSLFLMRWQLSGFVFSLLVLFPASFFFFFENIIVRSVRYYHREWKLVFFRESSVRGLAKRRPLLFKKRRTSW